jgi:hypothetical protein
MRKRLVGNGLSRINNQGIDAYSRQSDKNSLPQTYIHKKNHVCPHMSLSVERWKKKAEENIHECIQRLLIPQSLSLVAAQTDTLVYVEAWLYNFVLLSNACYC